MNPQHELLAAFDGHDADGVRAALDAGADVRDPINGKPAVDWLLEEYTRSDRLPDCLRLLLERGATVRDPLLTTVLLDDYDGVIRTARDHATLSVHRTTLNSAFTSLTDVTLLHVAAEFGSANAARALISLGADVNAFAGVDVHGLNGHTPLFHTVNSNANRSEPVMRMLLDAGADAAVRLNGLHWGKGYPWETVFFDVTLISFAQLGLLPQVHRHERDIYSNIRLLVERCGRTMPPLDNVPNGYLAGGNH